MTATRPAWYWCALGAFAMSLGWDQTFAPLQLAWTILVATTVVVVIFDARYPHPRVMLLLVTWAAVVSAFRYLLPPSSVGPEVGTMLMVFGVLALILSVMIHSERSATSGSTRAARRAGT